MLPGVSTGTVSFRRSYVTERPRCFTLLPQIGASRVYGSLWGSVFGQKPYYADPSPNPHGFAVENVPKGTGKILRKLRAVLRVLGLEFRGSG